MKLIFAKELCNPSKWYNTWFTFLKSTLEDFVSSLLVLYMIHFPNMVKYIAPIPMSPLSASKQLFLILPDTVSNLMYTFLNIQGSPPSDLVWTKLSPIWKIWIRNHFMLHWKVVQSFRGPNQIWRRHFFFFMDIFICFFLSFCVRWTKFF